MSRRHLTLCLSILALAGVTAFVSPVSSQEARGIFDVAQDKQTFYPVGAASVSADTRLDYYVMSGLTTTGRETARAAVLVNTATGPGTRIQIVEIHSVACAARTDTFTFRLIFNGKGQPLTGSGPVPPAGDDSVSLLTPYVEAQVRGFVCEGKTPAGALTDRTLADFRSAP